MACSYMRIGALEGLGDWSKVSGAVSVIPMHGRGLWVNALGLNAVRVNI